MAEVFVRDNEPLEKVLRLFKRKVEDEHILSDLKRHAFYLKPGEKRRAKKAAALKRLRKSQRRSERQPE